MKIRLYRFPAFFEVRFAEHLIKLSKAVWNYLYCMQKHWQLIIEKSDTDTFKIEKPKLKGFYALGQGGKQQKMTCLMMDLLKRIENLHKECQRSLITITHIEMT